MGGGRRLKMFVAIFCALAWVVASAAIPATAAESGQTSIRSSGESKASGQTTTSSGRSSGSSSVSRSGSTRTETRVSSGSTRTETRVNRGSSRAQQPSRTEVGSSSRSTTRHYRGRTETYVDRHSQYRRPRHDRRYYYGGHLHSYYYYPHHRYIYWGQPWWWYTWYWDSYYDYPYYQRSSRVIYGDRYSYSDAYSFVDIDVYPRHARVFVDGAYVGIADEFDGYPRYLELEPGRHLIEFELQGFRTISLEIYASRGHTLRLDYEMVRGYGADRLSRGAPPSYEGERGDGNPSGYGDPEYRPDYDDSGARPYGSAGAPPQGQRPSEPPQAPQVADSPGAQAYGEDEDLGTLKVKASPEGAAVYVDGEFWGTVQGSDWGFLYLRPGEHKVEITYPGYQAASQQVTVRSEEETPLEVHLSRGR